MEDGNIIGLLGNELSKRGFALEKAMGNPMGYEIVVTGKTVDEVVKELCNHTPSFGSCYSIWIATKGDNKSIVVVP
jgi:hypothetical protein